MLRTVTGLALMATVFAVSGSAAEVVSAKLCMDNDYDPVAKDCKPLEGQTISVPTGSVLTLLSAIKGNADGIIYHVWTTEGKTGKVSVYDAAAKTMKEADQADLDWLKDRKIAGAQVIVKLPVSASAAFRTRSVKTMGPNATGDWSVRIYDSGVEPLKEFKFTVTPTRSPATSD